MDGAILQTFISLSVLVLALCAILFVLKRYSKKNNLKKNINHNIQIISKTSILPKSHLFVVKADDKTLLLGAGENGVNLIADLSKNEQITQQQKNFSKASYKTKADVCRLPNSVNQIALSRKKNTENAKQTNNLQNIQKPLTQEEINKSLSFSNFLKSTFSRA